MKGCTQAEWRGSEFVTGEKLTKGWGKIGFSRGLVLMTNIYRPWLLVERFGGETGQSLALDPASIDFQPSSFNAISNFLPHQ
ncbi:MAG: hypothetical protein OXE78_04090 [Gammaproteobacteria bacterium]|nr:hypothetical protein [Gammaproteobacteria bacterium]